MTNASISIQPDTLSQLWARRTSEADDWDAIISNLLRPAEGQHADRAAAADRSNAPPKPAPGNANREPVSEGAKSSLESVRYRILGVTRWARTDVEAFVDILKTIAEIDPSVIERAAPRVRGRSRNHIGRSREQVYPLRPDLAKDAVEFVPGRFVGVNASSQAKARILKIVCEAARLKFGEDIQIGFRGDLRPRPPGTATRQRLTLDDI